MKRRTLLLLSGASALLGAARLDAQPKALPRVGWLFPFPFDEIRKRSLAAFVKKLRELGRVEGRDYAMEMRWTDGKNERIPALASELIALEPAVIVTSGSASIEVLKKATGTIPIVFASAANPVEQGFVKSLRRPGGNITGVALRVEINAKLIEMVRETLPAARRMALLVDSSDAVAKPMTDDFQKAASAFRFEMRVVGVRQPGDLSGAFAEMTGAKVEAVVVPPQSLFFQVGPALAEFSMKARIPLFSVPLHARLGGLLSYNADVPEYFRRSAVLVDKILGGANPAELAVEQPDRYFLTINMKTARAFGIKVPQSLLLRADEVIE